ELLLAGVFGHAVDVALIPLRLRRTLYLGRVVFLLHKWCAGKFGRTEGFYGREPGRQRNVPTLRPWRGHVSLPRRLLSGRRRGLGDEADAVQPRLLGGAHHFHHAAVRHRLVG